MSEQEITAEVELEQEPIELCKLLQILDLVDGGGQAKMLISEGYVGLNGEICTQKRKKIFGGDLLEFNGALFQILLSDNAEPLPEKQKTSEPEVKPGPSKNAKSKARKQKNKLKNAAKSSDPASGTGRKPISFG